MKTGTQKWSEQDQPNSETLAGRKQNSICTTVKLKPPFQAAEIFQILHTSVTTVPNSKSSYTTMVTEWRGALLLLLMTPVLCFLWKNKNKKQQS